MVFLLGTLCYKLKVFEAAASTKYYIISNVVLTISLTIFTGVALNIFFNIVNPDRNYNFISPIADRIFYYGSMLISMLCLLQIFIHAFRKSFNKSNWVLEQLNHNSYFVYIIHVIVIGLISLSIIDLAIPTYVKFLIVVVLTFIISNALVYIYRVLFQKFLSNKIITSIAVIAAIVLTIVITEKQNNQSNIVSNTIVDQTTASSPRIGLQMAAIQGNIDAVMQHIAAGTNINKKDPTGGSSPLLIASIFGKTDVALALIAAGADVNLQNNDGSAPLHTASFFCRPEIVKALLSNGADKNLKNNSGSTALESVSAPFESVVGIYDYFGNTLGPLGLKLDYEKIKKTRPAIAELLK